MLSKVHCSLGRDSSSKMRCVLLIITQHVMLRVFWSFIMWCSCYFCVPLGCEAYLCTRLISLDSFHYSELGVITLNAGKVIPEG